ncbi:MAG: PHP domain-containing protein [Clostridia bacterium]|nr:PHP domain-containing protein [Clostridia bacterium]
MKLYYDLHLHSCLSPCGDNEMTPFNLVNTMKVFGYDLIALTDHNSCRNCRAAMQAGKAAGITVVPGMELCTSEEIHVVCLFPDADSAEAFSALVRDNIPPVNNRPEIFGEQLVMDDADTVLDNEPLLLNTASYFSIDEVPALVAQYGGACFPAHIDRHSYSILSALGDFSEDLPVAAFELTMQADEAHYRDTYPALKDKLLLRDSDAHYLENILLPSQTINLTENTPQALIERLRQGI